MQYRSRTVTSRWARNPRASHSPPDQPMPTRPPRPPSHGGPAPRESCPPASRGGQTTNRVRSYPSSRSGARSMMLPCTPAACGSRAIRLAASRPTRSQSMTTDTRSPASKLRPLRLPRVVARLTGDRGNPRSRPVDRAHRGAASTLSHPLNSWEDCLGGRCCSTRRMRLRAFRISAGGPVGRRGPGAQQAPNLLALLRVAVRCAEAGCEARGARRARSSQ
jgi:hypothetical protein